MNEKPLELGSGVLPCMEPVSEFLVGRQGRHICKVVDPLGCGKTAAVDLEDLTSAASQHHGVSPLSE